MACSWENAKEGSGVAQNQAGPPRKCQTARPASSGAIQEKLRAGGPPVRIGWGPPPPHPPSGVMKLAGVYRQVGGPEAAQPGFLRPRPKERF